MEKKDKDSKPLEKKDKDSKPVGKEEKDSKPKFAVPGKIANAVESKKVDPADSKYVIGVTGCASGVAHTYMAAKKLSQECEKLGHKVKIETRGSKGVDHLLTEEDIKSADLVIIASDVDVPMDRFAGKKLFITTPGDSIKNPSAQISNAFMSGKTYVKQEKSVGGHSDVSERGDIYGNLSRKTNIQWWKHILSGLSYFIPFIVFSGIVFSILHAISILPGMTDASGAVKNDALALAMNVANGGFALMWAMMSGFIAISIAGRAAFAPAVIATFVGSSYVYMYGGALDPVNIFTMVHADTAKNLVQGVGFVTALICAFASGYLVKAVNSIKWNDNFITAVSILIIPILVTSIIAFSYSFLIGPWLNIAFGGVAYGLQQACNIAGLNFFIAFILGILIGFDLGGPINKIAYAVGLVMIKIDPRITGAVMTAIVIPPFGVGITNLIWGKYMTADTKAVSATALILGCMGITEGAIPYTAMRTWKAMIPNMAGAAIAGGFAMIFGVASTAGWGIVTVSPFLAVGTMNMDWFNRAAGSNMSPIGSYIGILYAFCAILIGIGVYFGISSAFNIQDVRANKNNPNYKIA